MERAPRHSTDVVIQSGTNRTWSWPRSVRC